MKHILKFCLLLSTSLLWTACAPSHSENFSAEMNSTSNASESDPTDPGSSDEPNDPPAPVGVSGACKTMTAIECQLFNAINEARKQNGMPLVYATKSACILEAQAHAADMAKNGYFSHDGLNETVEQRFARYGLTGAGWGENIAWNTSTNISSVVTMWMNSPGHRANILSSSFRSAGIGHATAGDRHYWVQCFSSSAGD